MFVSVRWRQDRSACQPISSEKHEKESEPVPGAACVLCDAMLAFTLMSVKVPARQCCYPAAGVGALPARALGWPHCGTCSSVSMRPQAGATRTRAPRGQHLLVARVRLCCAATRASSRTERALDWLLTRGRLCCPMRWVRLKRWGRSRTKRRSRAWPAACDSLLPPVSPSRASSGRRRGTVRPERSHQVSQVALVVVDGKAPTFSGE